MPNLPDNGPSLSSQVVLLLHTERWTLSVQNLPWVSPSVARLTELLASLPPRLVRHRPGHKHSFAQAGRSEGFPTFPSLQLSFLWKARNNKPHFDTNKGRKTDHGPPAHCSVVLAPEVSSSKPGRSTPEATVGLSAKAASMLSW